MKISIFGAGYVGLVSGVGLAHLGHQVVCYDIAEEKIALLNSGRLPIWEEGLQELLDQARATEKIEFTTDIKAAITKSDVLFITVGTPPLSDGSADLSQLFNVAKRIAEYCDDDKLVVIKSTVPVGTTKEVARVLSELTSNKEIEISVASNPEFLQQGKAIYDFLNPDRIIIGAESSKVQAIMLELYERFAERIQFHDCNSAEMIKYAANTFLAMKISYVNMLAGLCERVGANIENVAAGIGADERIGSSFLRAGVGYGGSCFPKDTAALVQTAKNVQLELPLVEATIRINQLQPETIFNKLRNVLGTLSGKKIALLGLTFKPKTDDLRDAPSLTISRLCLQEGAIINGYDPLVRSFPIKEVNLYDNPYAALDSCDAAVILTEWDEFRSLDWEQVAKHLATPLVIDGRNIFSLEEMREIAETLQITYLSVGRTPVVPYKNPLFHKIFLTS